MMNVYQPVTDMYFVFFIKYKIKSIACWLQWFLLLHKLNRIRIPLIRLPLSNNVVCATNKVSDQPAHTGSLIRAFASPLKLLLSEHHLEVFNLKGGCTGTSESTLVKMPHYWKSHVTAHI